MTAEKTWAQVETDIAETFRKWKVPHRHQYALYCNLVNTPNWRRRVHRPGQTVEERRVTLEFPIWDSQARVVRMVRLNMQRESSALGNLRALAQAVEWMRLADYRTITDLVVRFYRQMYPIPQQQQQQSNQQQQQSQQQTPPLASSGPYAVLHIVNNAPLEVAEAAYRALVKKTHPDVAGSTAHAQMVALNAAIEQIRRRHQQQQQQSQQGSQRA